MKTVAVIGSGISGMGAAYLLAKRYQVTLFEKNPVIGGHSRTKTVAFGDKKIPVDTGFIVFNYPTYPELVGLFRHLGVAHEKSNMSFAFTHGDGALEWGARNLNAVFGQRSNLLNPTFYKMIWDVRRFFKEAPLCLNRSEELTLGQLLTDMKLGDSFKHYFIIPMGAAIWSCPAEKMFDFPAKTFVRFFMNHGLMSFDGQHQWYTVTGGSQEYVKRITAPLAGKIRTDESITRVSKQDNKVAVENQRGEVYYFDEVVLACHGDEALAMLADATPEERAILSCFTYQANEAYLHSDPRFMPKRRACWASWNYHDGGAGKIALTYWMNLLQNIDDAYPLFVTLNPSTPPAPELTHDIHLFHHPVFTREAICAQEKIPTIQGKRGIWFAGAYQRYGFHEDGLLSAVKVAEMMGASIPWH
ncbi:MAG: FAD-dependent oxidoreductase [Rickettsiales bacterium]|jgi:predicted NAD/FAD-binding protein|nr:FAD-dependent oxidoreductase [Rickettsiales bacterium]